MVFRNKQEKLENSKVNSRLYGIQIEIPSLLTVFLAVPLIKLSCFLIKDDTPEEDASADMPIIDAQWKQRIREEINLVVEFETRLANITIPAGCCRAI